MLPLMEMVCYRFRHLSKLPKKVCNRFSNRLWKWCATLYATLLSYLRRYATALGNRLWKWYVTALGT